MAPFSKSFAATISIGILIFIGWLAVTSSKWEAVGCHDSIKLSLMYGAPDWYQFCMEDK